MKNIKQHYYGEISTIITFGVLIILSVVSLVSSVFLKNKQTIKTKAAEGCTIVEEISLSPSGPFKGGDNFDCKVKVNHQSRTIACGLSVNGGWPQNICSSDTNFKGWQGTTAVFGCTMPDNLSSDASFEMVGFDFSSNCGPQIGKRLKIQGESSATSPTTKTKAAAKCQWGDWDCAAEGCNNSVFCICANMGASACTSVGQMESNGSGNTCVANKWDNSWGCWGSSTSSGGGKCWQQATNYGACQQKGQCAQRNGDPNNGKWFRCGEDGLWKGPCNTEAECKGEVPTSPPQNPPGGSSNEICCYNTQSIRLSQTPTRTPQPGEEGGYCNKREYHYGYWEGTCDQGLVCDPINGVCVRPSTSPQPRTPSPGTEGGMCDHNNKCQGNLVCVYVPSGYGVKYCVKPTSTPIPLSETPILSLTLTPIIDPSGKCNNFQCSNNSSIKYSYKCANPSFGVCGGSWEFYRESNCSGNSIIANSYEYLKDNIINNFCKSQLRQIRLDFILKAKTPIKYQLENPKATFSLCYSNNINYGMGNTASICPITETFQLNEIDENGYTINKTINGPENLNWYLKFDPEGFWWSSTLTGSLEEKNGQITGEVYVN